VIGPNVLELKDITKKFGPILANSNISLTLRAGEILALLGENGAGKTTLMNIIFGHYQADSGKVTAFGKQLSSGRPRAAIIAGIGMVHQHFTLANNMTALDNVMIGTEPMRSIWTKRQAARSKLLVIAQKFGLAIDPDKRIADMSVGERQRVEILKALFREARILILDEPTAVLTQIEAEQLFSILRGMAKEGLSLIFISHKLGEVMRAADRIIVLKSGRVIAERSVAETNRDELAELMVGRHVSRPVRQASIRGEVMLAAKGLSVFEDGRASLENIFFEVRSGEVLGIIGVAGNGQAALGRLCSGLVQHSNGTLTYNGQSITHVSARELVSSGVARIPEDRHAEGVVGEMSVWENVILEKVRQRELSRYNLVNRKAAQASADALINQFDIRGATPDTKTRLLSGGNLQKLILGRNLTASPRLLVANQPTRGLDEGAVAAIHCELLDARQKGVAILLISEDLDEVVALSDRVQAVFKGRMSKAVETDNIDARKIGLMMAGIWEE